MNYIHNLRRFVNGTIAVGFEVHSCGAGFVGSEREWTNGVDGTKSLFTLGWYHMVPLAVRLSKIYIRRSRYKKNSSIFKHFQVHRIAHTSTIHFYSSAPTSKTMPNIVKPLPAEDANARYRELTLANERNHPDSDLQRDQVLWDRTDYTDVRLLCVS